MLIRHRVTTAAAAVIAAVAGLTLTSAEPAAATPTDRITLYGHGSYTTVTLHVFTQDGHDHTWGQIQWADFFTGCVWEDQTTDPTQQTWSGHLRQTCGNGALGLYTDGGSTSPLYDGPGYWVRACGDDWSGGVTCTPWN